MEAAQGYALNAAVNVSDRPVTGQGVMGMKAQNNNAGRIHDSGYYVGLLRKKTTEINKEITKLRTEVDQSSRDNTQYNQLEKKYETLARQKETLEGQLADYNLALDKTRSSTDPDDVHQMALHMADNNRKTGQELDRILVQRKQKEAETSQIEDQIEDQYRAIQKKIKDLEPGKLRAYNDLLNKQKEYHERLMHSEHKLNEINAKIRHYETDDKSNSLRKEFLNLEKA
jgi:DNA repair exonuclease SbcCD ATPase subunit